jgi:hypothetical protein
MTIVVHIQKVLMVVVALQLMCIVTTNQKCSVSTYTIPGLVHDIVASGNACVVFFLEQSHFMLFEYFDPCS